jgi:DNA-binding PadR family transcriptional regulator
LGFLAQGPAHGYELHQKLVTDLGQVWHISLSQTYNILNRLEAQNAIIGALQEQDKLPARRLFSLTSLGQERFEGWLGATSASSVRTIRLEFLTRLYFAIQRSPAFAHKVVDAQLASAQAGLERLRKLSGEIPQGQLVNNLSLELRIRQIESILDWLQGCRRAIDLNPHRDTEENKHLV